MPSLSRLLICALLLIGPASLAAQTSAPVRSALTGASLVAGGSLDKGTFTRMAAKSLLDIAAKDNGVTLSSEYEVFKLQAPSGGDLSASVLATLRDQGWAITIVSAKEPWGWMAKADQRFMVYFTADKRETWLYFAKPVALTVAQGNTPALPTPTRTQTTAPTPTPTAAPAPANTRPPAPSASPIQMPNGWQFTSTRFDDGWFAEDQPDWVRGTKGSITALVHHADFDMRPFVNEEGITYVWNHLVAPRFRDSGAVWFRKQWWEDSGSFNDGKYFAAADAVETATGKRIYVALFRWGSSGRWIEIHAPDRATFEREVTVVNQQGGTNWQAMRLDALNRFSVAARDLGGVWNSSSAAGVQYVNIYTGNSAGMAATSSVEAFTFRSDGTYTSTWRGASGMVGNQQFAGADYSGRLIMNSPWEMALTNRFKGATETYAVRFEAVKGGRVLVMTRNGTEARLFRTQ